MKTRLRSLQAALDAFDAAAIDEAVSGLSGFAVAPEVGSDVDAVLKNVLIGEYDEAMSLIDGLLQKDIVV